MTVTDRTLRRLAAALLLSLGLVPAAVLTALALDTLLSEEPRRLRWASEMPALDLQATEDTRP